MRLKNCIYRFLNDNNEIIYIGKAKDLKNRLSSHNHLPQQCYDERVEIEFVMFETEDEMDFAERYYIPKYKPKYNSVLADRSININIVEFDNKKWITLEEYNKIQMVKRLEEIEQEKIRKKNERKERTKKRKAEKEFQKAIIEAKEKYNIEIDTNEIKELWQINEIIDQCKQKQLKAERERLRKLEKIEERRKQEELKEYLSKKVMCGCTGEIFDNIVEFRNHMRATNSIDQLISVASGEYTFLDIYHPNHYGLFTIPIFLDRFESYDEKIKTNIKKSQYENTAKIICLTTGEIFSNKHEANDKINMHYCKIVNCCNGKSNYAGSLDGKPLVWKWYDEYLNMTQKEIEDYMLKATEIYNKKNKQIKQ